jgi:hypothetical protein
MMESIHHATPTQLAAHMSHKARMARIDARSIDRRPPPPAPIPKPPAPVVEMYGPPAPPPPPPKYPAVETITATCCRHFGVSLADMKCDGRAADIVRPRQVAMFLAKTHTLNSLPQIGRRFGGRDHTTVLHAVRKIGRLIREDWTVAHDVAAIEAEIGVCP